MSELSVTHLLSEAEKLQCELTPLPQPCNRSFIHKSSRQLKSIASKLETLQREGGTPSEVCDIETVTMHRQISIDLVDTAHDVLRAIPSFAELTTVRSNGRDPAPRL